jgi:hypothetical protein
MLAAGCWQLAAGCWSVVCGLRSEVLPLLTTNNKRVFWRGVAEELLWLLSGSKHAKEQLQEKNIRAGGGSGSASREHLGRAGLAGRAEGGFGPTCSPRWCCLGWLSGLLCRLVSSGTEAQVGPKPVFGLE